MTDLALFTSVDDLLGRDAPPYPDGQTRIRSAEATAEDLDGHLESVGITRVADVTGLDRIGIPVVMVVRPNSRSLAVSQGKGRDLVSARVSGIMESIELATAERATGPVWMTSTDDLRHHRRPYVDPTRLALARDTDYDERKILPWIEGFDLNAEQPILVPWELVHADASLPLAPGSGTFVRSTNGLASGNVPAEAVLHGLCEVVERDALALWELRSTDAQNATRVDPSTIDDAEAIELIARYERADIDTLMWAVTSEIGVPVFRVIIVDRHTHPVLKPLPAAFGAGCHPRRMVALVRALTEAAQSRLTAIAGARDDMTRARYRRTQSEASLEHHRQLARRSGTARYRDAPDIGGPTLEQDISTVLGALGNGSTRSIVAVPLNHSHKPWSVVRVVVSDLEGPVESPQYRPGKRAAAVSTGDTGPP